MEKKTVVLAVVEVLRAAKQPMTAIEITQTLLDKKMYGFSAKDPKGVVRKAIERHCQGLNRNDSAEPKYFRKLANGSYELDEATLRA